MTTVTATHVTFTVPEWQSSGTVQFSSKTAQGVILVTHMTPFHPVSHIWPDHPADRGVVVHNNQHFAVIDCLTGAYQLESGHLYIGRDIPVKRHEAGWLFVVVHIVDAPSAFTVGETVELAVDETYQHALSRGHSGAHFAALALNKVLHHAYWRKQPSRLDALGHYDFHAFAEQSSFVGEDSCKDTYRLGKTLRKRGLNSADLLNDLSAVEDKVNHQLSEWRDSGQTITMHRHGPLLTDSRYWQCTIDNKRVEIPCGGTHILALSGLSKLAVTLHSPSEQEVIMTTHTAPS
ncbi:metal-dependent hydrolase [Veronia pacifica]|uniref:Metal-dependent hydrolase n=1 Tax=Veronia pacifica TaxID=1080227 RepID=A0A1C3EC62_9GAMM|nr:metal-dependent hydrolase [Veronia pacifica]ODA30829.1 metal-dependent hydrolase [Veronia pacifica]